MEEGQREQGPEPGAETSCLGLWLGHSLHLSLVQPYKRARAWLGRPGGAAESALGASTPGMSHSPRACPCCFPH